MTEGGSTWKESISLEETNKIRISLGLKPISEGPSAAQSQESEAAANFAAKQAADRAERDTSALQAKLDKARSAKERARKLVGRGLGEEDESAGGVKAEAGAGVDDGGAGAKAWVRQQKRRQKELAAKRIRDEEEAERLLQEQGKVSYGESDLEGLKVSHGGDDFGEGEEHVLTLKDSAILDDEDDELHNINIAENTKTAERLALKRKGRQAGQYTGYDDDEFTPGGKAGVLAKYDDDILGKPDEGGFRLGGAMPPPSRKGGKSGLDEVEEEKSRVQLSMDYTKSFNDDYLKEGEAGFKIKKKKKRPTASRVTDASLDLGDGMEVDDVSGPPAALERESLDEKNLIDDDDLQASLARARREQNRKKVLAIKANAAKVGTSNGTGTGMELDDGEVKQGEDDAFGERTGAEDDALVLDDTSEFVRNIQLAAARPAPKVKRADSPLVPPPAEVPNGAASVLRSVKAEEQDVPISEMITSNEQLPEEGEIEKDTYMGDGGEHSMTPDDDEPKPKVESDDEFAGTAGEKLVSGGMASTLAMLKSRGLIKPKTAEELERDRANKEREAWLAQQRARDRERELERERSRAAGSSIDQAQREYENRMREQRDAQQTMDAFKNYKPVVNITYHDEFGRDQTAKEAYKQLSHTFHGKGSGAKKTEKRLKRIEEEQKQLRMQSGDTPTGTAAAFTARAERLGTATMVLSVGNRGQAPIQDELLDPAKKHDKGKGKQKTAPPKDEPAVFGDIPMRALPLPQANGAPEKSSASPAPRAGFQPVRSFTPIGHAGGSSADEGSREGTPGAGGLGKVFIPVAVKRKAEGELDGQSHKR